MDKSSVHLFLTLERLKQVRIYLNCYFICCITNKSIYIFLHIYNQWVIKLPFLGKIYLLLYCNNSLPV